VGQHFGRPFTRLPCQHGAGDDPLAVADRAHAADRRGRNATDHPVGRNHKALPVVELVEEPKRIYSNFIHGITELKVRIPV
jgi:hypothetical protein